MPDLQPQPRARSVFVVALYALALAAGAVVAFFAIFCQFQVYDDEGYIMMSVQSFLDGHPLFDDVYTQYGPFFYLCKGALHWLTALPVTHDVVRMTTIGVWLLTALLCSLFSFRVTGSMPVASAVYLLTFQALRVVTNEPGHPQELCALLLAASVYAASLASSAGRLIFVLACWGALAAALSLTKINVGVYSAIAFAGVMVSLAPSGRARSVAASMFIFLAALAPAVLMRAHLSTTWGQSYAAVATLSCLSASAVAILANRRAWIVPKAVAAMVVAFGVTTFLVLMVTVAGGTSLAGLWYGVVSQHFQFASTFALPARISFLAILSSIVASVAAVTYCLYQRKQIRLPVALAVALPMIGALVRLLLILMVVTSVLRGNSQQLFAYTIPWLWLAMACPSRLTPTPENMFSRTVVVLMAAFQMLQAYPVAGSQMGIATFLVVPVAAICCHDLWKKLQEADFRLSVRAIQVGKYIVYAAIVLLWCMIGRSSLKNYAGQTLLNLPGAHWIRVDEPQAAVFQLLSKNLHEHCDTFVTLPGMHSFHFWSDRKPPTALNATLWMTLLDDHQQRAIIAQLERHPEACLVRNEKLIRFWMQGGDLPDKPLVRYLNEQFKPVAQLGNYQLLVRSERRPTPRVASLPASQTSH